jgi:hypothetical protein
MHNRMRERWRRLLQIHAQRSRPLEDAAAGHSQGDWTPQTQQWSLHCSQRDELNALCCDYLIANKDYLLQACYIKHLRGTPSLQAVLEIGRWFRNVQTGSCCLMNVCWAQNGVDPNKSVEGLVIKHEVWTWELLHILFSDISGKSGEQTAEDEDGAMDAMLTDAEPSSVRSLALMAVADCPAPTWFSSGDCSKMVQKCSNAWIVHSHSLRMR